MNFAPEPYQLKMVDWFLSHDRAWSLTGMGLGKTASTLYALKAGQIMGRVHKALVVAPLRVCNVTWPLEAAKWGFEFRLCNLRDGFDPSADLYLVNYEQLPKMVDLFKSRTWDAVIFDETTKAKNHKSKRIEAIRQHLEQVPIVWGLTGTPSPNSLLEVFAQVRLIDGGKRFGRNFHAFKRRYFYPTDYMEYDWQPQPWAHKSIMEKIGDLAITLLSSDYLDIADTVTEDIPVEMPKDCLAKYKELETSLILLLQKGHVSAVSAGVLVNKLRQICSGAVYLTDANREWQELHRAKLDALAQIQKKHKEPILCLCDYAHEQERIGGERFDAAKTDAQQRRLVERWNAREIPLLVAHPASLGHGLNMQDGGRVIVWFTLPWSRELYDQTNARLARRGQDEIPLVYHLLCSGTIEDVVASTLQEKGDGQDTLLKSLSLLYDTRNPNHGPDRS